VQRKETTKVAALVQLIQDNGGQANWQTIYQKIGAYYPELKQTKKLDEIAKAGIRGVLYRVRGVLYRDCDKGRNIFTKIGNATFALQSGRLKT
jgi:hypothetical protein